MAWNADPSHQGKPCSNVNNVQNSTTFDALQARNFHSAYESGVQCNCLSCSVNALQTRGTFPPCQLDLADLCLAQGLGNHRVAMQLFWILVHLHLQQQHPGLGNAEAVFWLIHQAFLSANAPPDHDSLGARLP